MAELQSELWRREATEDGSQHAQKLDVIGRLAVGVAHDLNNHLTVISSNVELLKRRLRSDPEAAERLAEAAMQGVQRAAALTHRLLAFSRHQPPEPEPLDAGRLIASMLDLLRRTLGEFVTIEMVSADGLWLTCVDPNELENVIVTLAVDACDRMPDGGRLILEMSNVRLSAADAAVPPGDYVRVSVSNARTRLLPETNSSVIAPIPGGAGRDFSTLHAFMKQYGGHMSIETDAGCGTVVFMFFPRFVSQPPTAPPRARERKRQSAGGETILVVEDEDSLRRAEVEALHELGYVVVDAPDAMEAIRLVHDRGGIDLLFTDIGLPGGVNGQALADAARAIYPNLKVLFTTGYSDLFELQKLLRASTGTGFLGKPFDLQHLASEIRTLLDAAPECKARQQ